MDMRFGTWNGSRLYRAVSLTKSAKQLAKYKLYLVEVQQVRGERGGTGLGCDYIWVYIYRVSG
jgi:hypothetical protein